LIFMSKRMYKQKKRNVIIKKRKLKHQWNGPLHELLTDNNSRQSTDIVFVSDHSSSFLFLVEVFCQWISCTCINVCAWTEIEMKLDIYHQLFFFFLLSQMIELI
jgi:hypothetical protein